MTSFGGMATDRPCSLGQLQHVRVFRMSSLAGKAALITDAAWDGSNIFAAFA